LTDSPNFMLHTVFPKGVLGQEERLDVNVELIFWLCLLLSNVFWWFWNYLIYWWAYY